MGKTFNDLCKKTKFYIYISKVSSMLKALNKNSQTYLIKTMGLLELPKEQL